MRHNYHKKLVIHLSLSIFLGSHVIFSGIQASLSKKTSDALKIAKKLSTLVTCAAFGRPLKKIKDIQSHELYFPPEIWSIIHAYRTINDCAPRLSAATFSQEYDYTYPGNILSMNEVDNNVTFNHHTTIAHYVKMLSPDRMKYVHDQRLVRLDMASKIQQSRRLYWMDRSFRWSLDSSRVVGVDGSFYDQFPEVITIFDCKKNEFISIIPPFIKVPPKTTNWIRDVALNSDGSRLAIAFGCYIGGPPTLFNTGLIKIMDVATKKVVTEFEITNKRPLNTCIHSISYIARDTQLLLFGVFGLQIVDATQGTVLGSYTNFGTSHRVSTLKIALYCHADHEIAVLGASKDIDEKHRQYDYCQLWKSALTMACLSHETITLLELFELWRKKYTDIKLPTFAYAHGLDLQDINRVLHSSKDIKINGEIVKLKDLVYRVYDVKE